MIIGALAVIVLALGAGAWRLRAPTLSLQVVITSSPTGATLHHGDRVLGVTPWAGDLPDVAVELTLTARRPRRGLIIGALAVIVIALGAGAWRLRAPTLSLRQVVITSSPTGATLHHGDRVLGVTPWAGDLPDVAVELTLTAPGRKSTRVVLPPGESAPVDVQLAR